MRLAVGTSLLAMDAVVARAPSTTTRCATELGSWPWQALSLRTSFGWLNGLAMFLRMYSSLSMKLLSGSSLASCFPRDGRLLPTGGFGQCRWRLRVLGHGVSSGTLSVSLRCFEGRAVTRLRFRPCARHLPYGGCPLEVSASGGVGHWKLREDVVAVDFSASMSLP